MDRENVINGLECHFLIDMEPCEKCPYYGDINCTDTMAKDALELLKAQEAIEPSTYHHLFICPVCKIALFEGQKFCHECGRAVKWE